MVERAKNAVEHFFVGAPFFHAGVSECLRVVGRQFRVDFAGFVSAAVGQRDQQTLEIPARFAHQILFQITIHVLFVSRFDERDLFVRTRSQDFDQYTLKRRNKEQCN